MAWQNKAAKMAMGQFVRVKAERMAIVRFDGEPTEAKGKSFDGKPQDELQFPVTFYDERSVSDRYGEGEASKIVTESRGEAKMFPTSGGPLLRELMAEDRDESIMGRTFIISHTGSSRDTVYKFREVKAPKQRILTPPPEDDEEEEEAEEEEEEVARSGPHPRRDEPKKPTKKLRFVEEEQPEEEEEQPAPAKKPRKPRTPKVKYADEVPVKQVLVKDGKVVPKEERAVEDPEKAAFNAKVKARAAKVKAQEASQDPPDEPDHDPDEDEEEGEE